jgi:hypothetical protein
MSPAGHRVTAARACLDEVIQTPVDHLRPSQMMAELELLRGHLGAVLAVLDGQPDDEPQEAAP